MMTEKWLSLGNHIQNLHVHDGALFPSCEHPPLEGTERKKKWFKPGTKVCEKVHDLICSNQMKRDVPKLSTGPQTATLEGFHSIINHFAPKMIGFSYHGMLSRIKVAALHYNENGMRKQATTRDGTKKYSEVYPKFKKDYAQHLTETVLAMAQDCHMTEEESVELSAAPPPLCSTFEKPNKSEAIKQQTSRYNTFGTDLCYQSDKR